MEYPANSSFETKKVVFVNRKVDSLIKDSRHWNKLV
jgi:hypothetical protein